MDYLKQLNVEEIIDLIKEEKVTVADIIDSGICPTCFDKENNHILYGDNRDKIFYEDDMFECFLVGNPRANGHVAISTKKHFKDMMEIDDEICREIFLLSKRVMNILKEVYNSESNGSWWRRQRACPHQKNQRKQKSNRNLCAAW